ncbi:uncharacterized protein SCHCODRAFT_02727382 [Schizophyllum commune H4-8]|nr:uncharacterized protein SCHCODRAFT_02727382 [Schizophyllum commune H4-8]KAI5895111.1 hypothetical protein SCHCODRAFT_02727382 [Schizophyllum commune H4-8]
MSGIFSNLLPATPKDKLKKAGVILDRLRSQLEQEPDERVKMDFQAQVIEHERILIALSQESSWRHPLDHMRNVNTAVAELGETKDQFLTASEEARKREEAARKEEARVAQLQAAVTKMYETYDKHVSLRRRPPVPVELQPQELAPKMKSRSASTHTTDMPSAGASAASVGGFTKGHRHTDTAAFGESGASRSAVHHSGSDAYGRARTSEEHSMMSKTSSYGSSYALFFIVSVNCSFVQVLTSTPPRADLDRVSSIYMIRFVTGYELIDRVFGGRPPETSDNSHSGHSARSIDSAGDRRYKEAGIYSISSADITRTPASGPYTNYTHAKKESMSASRSTSELNTSQWQRERTPAFLNAPGAPVQHHGDPRGTHGGRKTRGRETLAPPAQYPSGPTGSTYPVGSVGYSSGTNYPASGGGYSARGGAPPAAGPSAGGSAYLAPSGGAYHAQPGGSYYPPGGAYHPPGPGQPPSSGHHPAPPQAPYSGPMQPPRQSSSHEHSSKHGGGRR